MFKPRRSIRKARWFIFKPRGSIVKVPSVAAEAPGHRHDASGMACPALLDGRHQSGTFKPSALASLSWLPSKVRNSDAPKGSGDATCKATGIPAKRPRLGGSSPACGRAHPGIRCQDGRSSFLAPQLGFAQGGDLFHREYPITPNLVQPGHDVRLGGRPGCGSGGQRGELGKGASSLQDLHGFPMLNPGRHLSEAIAQVGHGRCLHWRCDLL